MELTANIGISRGKCHLRHKKAPKRFVFPRYMLTTSNKPGAFVGKCAAVSLSRSRNNHIGATCFLIPLRFRSSPPREEKTAAGNQITTPCFLLPIRIILPSENVRHAPQSRRDYSKNGEEIKENREHFVISLLVFPANARLMLLFYPIPTTSVALSKCHSPFCVRCSVIHIPLNADKAIIQLFGIRGNALFNPDAADSSAKSSYLCQ